MGISSWIALYLDVSKFLKNHLNNHHHSATTTYDVFTEHQLHIGPWFLPSGFALSSELAPCSPRPLPPKKEEGRVERERKKGFLFLSYKTEFSPVEFRCSAFSLFCLKNNFAIT